MSSNAQQQPPVSFANVRALIGKEFASSSSVTSAFWQGQLKDVAERAQLLKMAQASSIPDEALRLAVVKELDRLRDCAKDFADRRDQAKAKEDIDMIVRWTDEDHANRLKAEAQEAQRAKWREDKRKQRQAKGETKHKLKCKQSAAAKAAGLPLPKASNLGKRKVVPVSEEVPLIQKPMGQLFNAVVDSIVAPTPAKAQKAEAVAGAAEVKVPVIPIPECPICLETPLPSMIGTFCDNSHAHCFRCVQKLILGTYAMKTTMNRVNSTDFVGTVVAESNRTSHSAARLSCSICRTGSLPELTMQGFRFYFDPVSSEMLAKQMPPDQLQAALTCSGCNTASGSLLQAFNHFKVCTSFPWPCVHSDCTKTVGKSPKRDDKTIKTDDIKATRALFAGRFVHHFNDHCAKPHQLCTQGCVNRMLNLGELAGHLNWHEVKLRQSEAASALAKLAPTMPLAAHWLKSPRLFDVPPTDVIARTVTNGLCDVLELLRDLTNRDLTRHAAVFAGGVQADEKKMDVVPPPPLPVPAPVAAAAAAGPMPPVPPMPRAAAAIRPEVCRLLSLLLSFFFVV
jgi:hypothetical protein